MPNFKGHLIGGAGAFAIAKIAVCGMTPVLFASCLLRQAWQELFFCLLGSLFPDIDIHSKGRQILYLFCLLISFYCFSVKIYAPILCCVLAIIFSHSVGHRKIAHNPLFVLVAPICFFSLLQSQLTILPQLSMSEYKFFVIGAFSHLFLDLIPKRFLPGFFFDNKLPKIISRKRILPF